MPFFTYLARSIGGEVVRGTVNAATAEVAREQLRKEHLIVESLQESEPHPPVTNAKDILSNVWEEVPGPVNTAAASSAAMTSSSEETLTGYAPLLETLRLFAGWLLAWYGIVYALGSYQWMNSLPFDIPFVEGLFFSPLVLRLTLGTFLFLLLTTLHKAVGGGTARGMLLTIVGVILFGLFHVNA